MQLVIPSLRYKESFLDTLEEYKSEKSNSLLDSPSLHIPELRSNFELYLKKLLDDADGKNLPQGYVAQTVYWLIDGEEFIGRVDIRHSLTESLLREGGHIGYNIRPSKRNQGYGKKLLSLVLPKAKELGITKVLVTCDETNIASKKIIEANGGVFENSVELKEGKPKKLRYWIDLIK
jgi:predicted acetyltransferase